MKRLIIPQLINQLFRALFVEHLEYPQACVAGDACGNGMIPTELRPTHRHKVLP